MAEDFTSNQGSASAKTHAKIDNAAERVKQGTSHAAQGARDTVDAATGSAEARIDQAVDASARAAHRTADRAADWRERGASAVDNVRDRVGDMFDAARGFVREKPVESVALALAAGWVIGRLLRPRH